MPVFFEAKSTNEIVNYVIWIILGYLSGSVLYAYWIPWIFQKKDITADSPDHNPGTANVFRNAGIPTGIVVLICELLKGALPVGLVAHFWGTRHILFAAVLCAPVIGHAFPLTRKIKGGKAIAVSFGCLIGLLPEYKPLVYLILFYLFFSLIIKIYPHLYRSVVTFSCFLAVVCFNVDNQNICYGCAVISVVVVYKHLIKYQGEKPELKMAWKNGSK